MKANNEAMKGVVKMMMVKMMMVKMMMVKMMMMMFRMNSPKRKIQRGT